MVTIEDLLAMQLSKHYYSRLVKTKTEKIGQGYVGIFLKSLKGKINIKI